MPSWTAAGAIKPIPAVAVFVAVPAKELLAMSAGIFDRAEPIGEVGQVLQSFELRLGVRIVIRECGRLWVFATSRSISAATGLDRMLVPRSACRRHRSTCKLPSFVQHLSLLEQSRLVRSKKRGRVRTYEIQPEQFKVIEDWLTARRQLWESRLNRFDQYVKQLKEKESDS